MVTCLGRNRMLAGWAVALGVLVLSTGCADGDWAVTGLRDDVVAIRQYIPAVPWLWDEEGRVNGMYARVYFLSAKTGKGTFVPGTIKVRLHAMAPRPDGTRERELVHEWTFNQQQAAGYRVQKAAVMGNSYGFVLRWPADDIDLAGREVQLMYSYEGLRGKLVERRGSRFWVPLPESHAVLRRARSTPNTERSAPAREPRTETRPR